MGYLLKHTKMDADLQQLRAQRMAEMQAGRQMDPEKMKQMEQQKVEMEDRRRTLLRAVCDNEALDRLARITLVKPDKARKVEDMILQMAQMGRLPGKIDEGGLINLLEKVTEVSGGNGPKVTIQRRRFSDDDD
eukprot:GDKI01041161.1.p2 GENE.GDKI01041161.1~~GDKI01041161.1.p2  ORF type:complete len:133 (+),score=47.20 GDKI01041161.1:1-399(+)